MEHIIVTITLDCGVPDLKHFPGCKTVSEAAAQEQRNYDEGAFCIEDIVGLSDHDPEVKYEAVEK